MSEQLEKKLDHLCYLVERLCNILEPKEHRRPGRPKDPVVQIHQASNGVMGHPDMIEDEPFENETPANERGIVFEKSKNVRFDQIKVAFLSYANMFQVEDRALAKQLMTGLLLKFSCDKLSDLKESDYNDFMDDLIEMIQRRKEVMNHA